MINQQQLKYILEQLLLKSIENTLQKRHKIIGSNFIKLKQNQKTFINLKPSELDESMINIQEIYTMNLQSLFNRIEIKELQSDFCKRLDIQINQNWEQDQRSINELLNDINKELVIN